MVAHGRRGKAADDLVDPSNPWTHFREATWTRRSDRAAKGLAKIRDRDGPRALAGFGSAKGSNEEAYLFQKLVRTGFGTNMSITARGSATPRRSPPCSRASASAAVSATLQRAEELRTSSS